MGRQSRVTKQKELLAAALARFTTFFTAEDVCLRVPAVGKATVYRYLKHAVACGDLHPYSCGNHTIYSSRKESHCHFICEKTGRVQHFTLDSLDFLEGKLPGKVRSFQIEIRGVCHEACDACDHE